MIGWGNGKVVRVDSFWLKHLFTWVILALNFQNVMLRSHSCARYCLLLKLMLILTLLTLNISSLSLQKSIKSRHYYKINRANFNFIHIPGLLSSQLSSLNCYTYTYFNNCSISCWYYSVVKNSHLSAHNFYF